MHLDRQTCLLGLVLLTSLLFSSDATPSKAAPRTKTVNSKSKPYDLKPYPAHLTIKHSHVNPLDTELVNESFDKLLQLTRTQDHDFDPEYIRSTLADIESRIAQVSPLPMALILHGTLTYDNPAEAYEKAEGVASSFSTALRLVRTRLHLIESRGLGDMPSFLHEEHKEFSKLPLCKEAESLLNCLRKLSKKYGEEARHFSHPTSPELYDPVLKAPKMRLVISPRACPAWLTDTPPWSLVPSAIHALSLSQKPDTHLPKMLMEWIMCISIGFSNLSRKQGVSPIYRTLMRNMVYLLEDMIEETLRSNAYNPENFISTGLYKEFMDIVKKDESTRHGHLDYKKNGELSIIDKTTPSAYTYNLLQALIPSQSRPSPTKPSMSTYARRKTKRRKHEVILSDLAWSKPKGRILKGVMTTWIQNYINDYEAGRKPLPIPKNYSTCKDLLGDLVPIAIQEVTKQEALKKELKEEVLSFLDDRIVLNDRKLVRFFKEGKADLSKVSQSSYVGFMITSKFHPSPRIGLKYCIRDFLYAIHRSYDEHRDMIGAME